MFTVVPESAGNEDRTGSVALGESSSVIDDIVREGARRLLAEALGAEVEVCIAGLAEECDEAGRRLVVMVVSSGVTGGRWGCVAP